MTGPPVLRFPCISRIRRYLSRIPDPSNPPSPRTCAHLWRLWPKRTLWNGGLRLTVDPICRVDGEPLTTLKPDLGDVGENTRSLPDARGAS